ncbi:MAG TPA: prepilin-type N-terminal cleavage/methylation domain-containing protein [bacterium]|nr:prepilin-type N-terminal cleavage/methylation domain-containing protein [bacterium]HOL34337.1 prepilin-type N-terminal cleavage/methylation domain-containing protein [bacterium]HPP08001.1 prepilin-type N-terminal cleavage/methylation domain-containing protein [bacterium]
MKKRFHAGFTIIEFLLAFVIIAIALIGTSAFYFASSRNLSQSDITRLATWCAIEKIEMIKSADYSQIQNETENIRVGNIQVQRITNVVPDQTLPLKTVTVKIQVPDGKEIVSISTMIAQP